jgi:Mg2+/Co2+ transporter CorB
MLTLYIIISLILLLLSAFFSASETGITAASEAKIHNLKNDGSKAAGRVSELQKQGDKLISTILIGNNIANTALTAMVTACTYHYLDEDAVYYTTIIIALVIIIFAEVLPKTIAINNPEKVALLFSIPLYYLIKIFTPINLLVKKIVGVFTWIMRIHKIKDDFDGKETLRGAIELHHDEGDVYKDDKDMLGAILDLAHTEVSDVMRHRKDMEVIDINQSNENFIKAVTNSTYSRIPVYDGNPDNIIGIIHTKTLMRAINSATEASKLEIKKILKDPWFVPETTTLKEQLMAFRERHQHFALVVDEYGSILGLITLEDILEEIVGDIEDEFDVDFHIITDNNDGSYTIDGSLPIRDLNRELDWDLPTDGASTIAGLIIDEAEIIPSISQIFNFHGYRFEILKKKRNQITKIKISQL